jgi:hypothetical protein
MYKNYLIFPNSSTEIPGNRQFFKNIINFALFTIYKKSDKIIENEKLDFYKISNSIFSNF